MPALLYGLAAASVPIIIHLLNRRKFREMPWAAMRFLLAAIRKNSAADPDRAVAPAGRPDAGHPAGRLGDGQAVSREPRRRPIAGPADAPGARARRLAEHGLHRRADVSRFDQAKAARRRSSSRTRGAATPISVVLMGDPPRVVIGDPSPNLAEVAEGDRRARRMPHGGTDLAATLRGRSTASSTSRRSPRRRSSS